MLLLLLLQLIAVGLVQYWNISEACRGKHSLCAS